MKRRASWWTGALVVAGCALGSGGARAEPPPAFPGVSPAPGKGEANPAYRDLLPFGMRGRGLPKRAWLEKGLAYLRGTQQEDGGWRAGGAYRQFDLGVTALASLAFLAAGVVPGETTESGRALAKAIDLLVKEQGADGCIGARSDGHFVYVHAFSALALVEAFGATGDEALRGAAQKALDFAGVARNPYFAWRYGVKPGDNDTSVTGCMLLALHTARVVNRAGAEAGLLPAFTYDDEAFESVAFWIAKMTDPDTGRVGYNKRGGAGTRPDDATAQKFPFEKSEAMTAIGVFGWVFVGLEASKREVDDDPVAEGAALLLRTPPGPNASDGSFDLYYWFWGSLAMRSVGGKASMAWLAALQQSLLPVIDSDEEFWSTCDPWCGIGGPVYARSMALLSLQTGERYEWGPEERLAVLRGAGADRPPEVRAAALRALALRPQKGTAAAAIAALRSPDLALRRASMRALVGTATKAEAAALAKAVTDPDDEVAADAVLAVGRLRVATAVPDLTRALASPSPRFRCSVLWALGELGPSAAPAADAIARLLSDPVPLVQVEAARVVGRLRGGTAPILDRLTSYVASDDAFLRVRALRAIEAFGPAATAAVDVVRRAVAHADPDTSIAASRALRALGWEARGARIALQEAAVFGATAAVRAAAVGALEDIDSPTGDSLPHVGAGSGSPPPLPTEASGVAVLLKDPVTAAALRPSLRLPNAVLLLIPLLEHSDEGVRVRALEALADLGPAGKDAGIPRLASAVRGESRVAAAALRALARVMPASTDAADVFAKHLSSPSAEVRAAALDGLVSSRSAPVGVLPSLAAFIGRDARPQVLLALQCSARWGATDAALGAFYAVFESRPDLVLGALTGSTPLAPAAVPIILKYVAGRKSLGEGTGSSRDALAEVGRRDAGARNAIVESWRLDANSFLAEVLVAIGRPIAIPIASDLRDADPERQAAAAALLSRLGKDAAPAIPQIVSGLRLSQSAWATFVLPPLFGDSLGAEGRAALVSALGSSNPEIRGGAATLMRAIAVHGRKGFAEFGRALESAMSREKEAEVFNRMAAARKANGR